MARRKAKKATETYLERVAIWYLERYPGSVARVRRALDKRVRRSVEELGTDPEEGQAALEAVLAKLTRMGMLDDARFARSRVRTLRNRGKSARAIKAALRAQGIDPDTADEVLAEHDDDDGGGDLEAARAFVRRRRLGPHRSEAKRVALREKDLARLARGGFSFSVARQVLDEELDA